MRATAPSVAIGLREWSLTGSRTAASDRLLGMSRAELDRAYRLAGLLLGDAVEAEDATQEALLRAWQSIDSLRDPQGFGAWFDRILVNGCRDRLRRRRKIRFIPLDAEAGASGGIAGDPFRLVHDRDEVLGAMVGLDDDQRLVVVLHYWADLTLQDVANRVGWPIGTVKSRLHAALERMRRRLGEGIGEPTEAGG
jgi:RNA polymerase sigma-70 factor (ECF subfamily)